MKRELLEDEAVVATWNGVTVTTLRVMHSWTRGSQQGVQSLSLAKVQFTAVVRTHHSALVAIAALCLLAAGLIAAVGGSAGAIVFCVGLAGVLGLVYWMTRSLELHVGAGAGLIRSQVSGGKAGADAATAFLQLVDWAVARRENEL